MLGLSQNLSSEGRPTIKFAEVLLSIVMNSPFPEGFPACLTVDQCGITIFVIYTFVFIHVFLLMYCAAIIVLLQGHVSLANWVIVLRAKKD